MEKQPVTMITIVTNETVPTIVIAVTFVNIVSDVAN